MVRHHDQDERGEDGAMRYDIILPLLKEGFITQLGGLAQLLLSWKIQGET